MKELFEYLFKPFKHDREAVRSAYYGSLRPTHVMLLIAFIMCLFFLILSFINPALFGTTLIYHRICYSILLSRAWFGLFLPDMRHWITRTDTTSYLS